MLPCWQRKPKEGVIVGMHVTHIIGFLSHMLLRHFDPVQTTMAYIRDDHIVDIPSVSMRVPPNPLLGYDKRATAPPSTAATSTAGLCQSTLAHRVLLYDQRCLITGAASNQLQACHLINTICMDKSNQGEKLCIKKDVEHILTRQQFGIGEFSLDSLSNCISMEAQWHGDLDTYGSFCIVIPLGQVGNILTELSSCNDDWDHRAKSDPQAPRNLDITQDPFIVQKCVLLVLRPDLFLPDDRPLLINTNCALRTPGGPPLARSGRSSWVSYYSNNTPFLVDSNDHSYWHFEFKSLRQPTDSLSVFSLLVNANSKLQNIKHQINDPILISYATIIEATVGAIFHVPEGLQNQDSPVPSNLPTPCPSITDPGPSTKHHGDRGDYKQDSMDLDHQDGSGAKEDHIDSYINSDEPSDEDDDPDMVNGLTFPEMRMVLQQVSDGRISDQERAEAAMLMLGMAGGLRHSQAVSPLVKDYL